MLAMDCFYINWHIVLGLLCGVISIAVLVFAINWARHNQVVKNCLLGFYSLLQSPSGAFSLLVLLCITLVTLKMPSVGGVAFAAFCSVIPVALGFFEHKETMAGLPQVLPPPPPPAPPPASSILADISVMAQSPGSAKPLINPTNV